MNIEVLLSVGLALTLLMVLSGFVVLRHSDREAKLRDRLRMANGTFVSAAAKAAAPAPPKSGTALVRIVSGIGARIVSSGLLSHKTVAELETTLTVAGMSGRHALGMFIGSKVLLLVGLPAAALLLAQNMELDRYGRQCAAGGRGHGRPDRPRHDGAPAAQPLCEEG